MVTNRPRIQVIGWSPKVPGVFRVSRFEVSPILVDWRVSLNAKGSKVRPKIFSPQWCNSWWWITMVERIRTKLTLKNKSKITTQTFLKENHLRQWMAMAIDSYISKHHEKKKSKVNYGANSPLPIGSMYGVFDFIYHKDQPNVGNYAIHGWYGLVSLNNGLISPPSFWPGGEVVRD